MVTQPAGRRAGSAPTLETVAHRAGVSRATVSRVVNGDDRVAEHLRAAVERAVGELGFVPNRAARALAGRTPDSVALIMREPAAFGAVDPYLSSMVVGLSNALVGPGLQFVVMMAPKDRDDAAVASYARAHVDAVLLISVHDDDALPGVLAAAGLPVVTGGRLRVPVVGVSSVDVDNVGGARLATEHLISRGRTRIGCIAGALDARSGSDRKAGFLLAMQAAGLSDSLVVEGDWTAQSGQAAAAQLLRSAPDLDGIVAGSDVMAMGALHAIRAAGRRVPEDVAVVGFDDIDLASHTSPPLTTVRQPAAHQAQRMIDVLLARLDGGVEDTEIELPVELVIRESS